MKLVFFDALLAKEMDRKEFLIHLGVLLLVITGISGMLKTLADPHLAMTHKKSSLIASKGFGGGPYGA